MDCIDKILDFYNNREIYKVHEIKICLGTILIELMNDLNDPVNLFRVQNCLILLINLFFNIKYPDHLHEQGKPISDLSEDELKIVNDLLRSELNCELY
ncbi:MAG: hypothetical protein ACFFAH_08260 [Promethearchaeota archaeon]